MSTPSFDPTHYYPSYINPHPALTMEQFRLIQQAWKRVKDGQCEAFTAQTLIAGHMRADEGWSNPWAVRRVANFSDVSCLSQSTKWVSKPASLSIVARLVAMVLLPVPPFSPPTRIHRCARIICFLGKRLLRCHM